MSFYKNNLLKEKSVMMLFALLLSVFMFVFVSCADQKARDETAALSTKFDEYVANQATEKEAEAKARAEEVASFKASIDEIKTGLSSVKQSIASINAVNTQQTKDISKIKGAQELLTNLYDKMDVKYSEMQRSLGEIQGQVSDSTRLSSEDISKLNESIALLKESTLNLETNKATRSDVEGLDLRIKAIESIDINALISRVSSLEEFKVYMTDTENANTFVKNLQCVKEYVELIANMQDQIRKLQTDFEDHKNTGQPATGVDTGQPANTPVDEKASSPPTATPEIIQPSITGVTDDQGAVPVEPVNENKPPVTN